MNVYKLPGRLYLSTGASMVIPRDPYHIYKRLAQIAFNTSFEYREENAVSIFNRIGNQWLDFEITSDSISVDNFWFIRWVLQELPREFWKYNVNIDVCKKQIRASAMGSQKEFKYQSWIDMPGKEKKIKQSLINKHLLEELEAKRLILPSYDAIVAQVKDWGNNTKYCYGVVNEVQSNIQF